MAAYLVKLNVNGRKKRHRIYSTPETQRKTRIKQRPFNECCFEFLAAIFIFLVVLSILAGIACLLN